LISSRKLNYLEKGTCADISYITHQCAGFAVDPKREHGEALKWLGGYLKGTSNKGFIMKPDGMSGLEVYMSGIHKTPCHVIAYIVKFNNCPILWKSQMAMEIALLSTESKYAGASVALREALPVMELLKEMKEMKVPISDCKAKIPCKLYKDNSGALEILQHKRYSPRTKCLLVKLHHFWDYVTRGEITVHPIRNHDQQADYLTKPVNESMIGKLRGLIQGW
jgi:hypothetical protein